MLLKQMLSLFEFSGYSDMLINVTLDLQIFLREITKPALLHKPTSKGLFSNIILK